MLVRMFGIFGLILASGYLIQGVSLISRTRDAFLQHDAQDLAYSFSVMSLDFMFGIALMIAAIGLLFVQRWARKMWLLVLSILGILQLLLAALHQLGRGLSTFYLIWTWMVMLALALSWWVLTKPAKGAPSGAKGQAALLPPSVPPH